MKVFQNIRNTSFLLLILIVVIPTASVCVLVTPASHSIGGKNDDAIVASSEINPRFSDVYAVIVGVADYTGFFNDLRYSDDDARDIADLVENTFHIPSTHVKVLLNAQATTAAISRALTDFGTLMDDDDSLFFYFSGHGSNSICQGGIHDWSIASPHEYPNSYEHFWNYSFPGAELMRVHFTRIDVEETYDAVLIGDDHNRSIAYDYFSGSYTNVWSDWVPTDRLFVELASDYSDTGWGFEVDHIQVGSFSAPYYIYPCDPGLEGITGGQLDSILDTIPGKVISVLDSCFSGGIASTIASEGRYTVAASSYKESSLEDQVTENGAFTYEFLRSWTLGLDVNSDGALSFEEIFPLTYTNTISRSTAIGQVHHPVENDNIQGDVVFEPNVKLNAVFESPGNDLTVNFTQNGIGCGDIVVAYYNAANRTYYRAYQNTSMIGHPGQNVLTVTAPAGGFVVNGYALALNGHSHMVNKSARSFRQDPGTFTSTDADGDGLSDVYEFEHALNPWATDTDGDGISDSQEVDYGMSPLVADLDRDYDGDYIPCGWEISYGLHPGSPSLTSDQDGDGFLDWQEFKYGANPLKGDTDGDGLGDYLEFALDFDFLDADMDGDSFPDGIEYYLGANPTNPNDTPWFHILAINIVVVSGLSIVLSGKFHGRSKPATPSRRRPLDKTRYSWIYRKWRRIRAVTCMECGKLVPKSISIPKCKVCRVDLCFTCSWKRQGICTWCYSHAPANLVRKNKAINVSLVALPPIIIFLPIPAPALFLIASNPTIILLMLGYASALCGMLGFMKFKAIKALINEIPDEIDQLAKGYTTKYVPGFVDGVKRVALKEAIVDDRIAPITTSEPVQISNPVKDKTPEPSVSADNPSSVEPRARIDVERVKDDTTLRVCDSCKFKFRRAPGSLQICTVCGNINWD